jgi:hypothetical protein
VKYTIPLYFKTSAAAGSIEAFVNGVAGGEVTRIFSTNAGPISVDRLDYLELGAGNFQFTDGSYDINPLTDVSFQGLYQSWAEGNTNQIVATIQGRVVAVLSSILFDGHMGGGFNAGDRFILFSAAV